MADAVQVVVTEMGERINTPIVYDRKMGDTVTKSDLEKAKNYKTIHNTDYSIIVTTKGIRNSHFTEKREGILLVHPMVLIDVAKRIRSFIIEASKQEKSNTAIDSKQAKIYKFVTSAEYNRNVRMKIGIKSDLDEIQRKEEDYHRTVWHRRKEFVDKWFERAYNEYFKLLGLTEFTKVYIQIKDNPWPYVNLARLVHHARMGDGEVVELLRIANGYLPRVRLEYDRVKEEKNSLEAELNSWKAELNSIARTYQQFVDRNINESSV